MKTPLIALYRRLNALSKYHKIEILIREVNAKRIAFGYRTKDRNGAHPFQYLTLQTIFLNIILLAAKR